MPPELRYNICLEIYQPRVFQARIHQPLESLISLGVDHPGCETSTSALCWDFPNCQRDHFTEWADEPKRAGYHSHHHNRGCLFKGFASLLRVCQDVYIEAQPVLLRNSTLAFHRYHRLDPDRNHIGPLSPPRNVVVTQLKAFHQNHLRSSLSGLDPTACLRRLRLAIYRFDYENVAALNFISRHKWKLDLLEIKWQQGHLDFYLVPWFLDSKCLRSISRLRGLVKQMTFSWPVEPSLALPDSDHHYHEPAADSELAQGPVRAAEYEQVITRLLTKLAAPPRKQKGQASGQRSLEDAEADAIFLARLRCSHGPGIAVVEAPNIMKCTISFSPALDDGARVGPLQTILGY